MPLGSSSAAPVINPGPSFSKTESSGSFRAAARFNPCLMQPVAENVQVPIWFGDRARSRKNLKISLDASGPWISV